MKAVGRRRRRRALLIGCSEDAPPTKAQYSGAADGVCQAAPTRSRNVKDHFADTPDGGANQRFVRAEVIPRLRTMTGQLRGIPAPENDGAYLAECTRATTTPSTSGTATRSGPLGPGR